MVANLIAPTLTEHDLQERKNHITATDAPAIMGVSPWKTAYDVWCEKCLDLEPLKPSNAMLWGSLLEDDVLEYGRARLVDHLKDPDLRITRVGTRRRHANGVMSCSLDARICGRPDALEAKTHALFHGRIDEGWGNEEFSDEVPEHYKVQVLTQLACCPDLERVWIVLTIGKATPVIYCIQRKNYLERIAEIENACCDFWDRYVITNTPPPDAPTLATIKRVRTPAEAGSIAELPDELLERNRELVRQIKRLSEEKEETDARIRAALVGHESGRSPRGHVACLKVINKKEFTVKASTYSRLDVNVAGVLIN